MRFLIHKCSAAVFIIVSAGSLEEDPAPRDAVRTNNLYNRFTVSAGSLEEDPAPRDAVRTNNLYNRL